MIEYTETIDSFYDLQNKLSNSALLDLEEIEKRHLEDDLMNFLSELTWNSFTEIDDFIDYEMDYILEMLGVDEDDEEEE